MYYLIVETTGKSLKQTDRWFVSNSGWLVHKADHSWAPEGDSVDDEETLEGKGENEGMVKAFWEEGVEKGD